MNPIRIRDFIEDQEGCIYAVSAYDNDESVGCILRYVPDEDGKRQSPDGTGYTKYDFEEAFEYIRNNKPEYLDTIHRVPLKDIQKVFKPEEEIQKICRRDRRVERLVSLFNVSPKNTGCTGSLLVGLDNEASDIDMVVYGDEWFTAQKNLMNAVRRGVMKPLSDELWNKVYTKRIPEIDYDTFVLHEKRKWNRGEIDGTYFDLLYTRSYENLNALKISKGKNLGKKTIEARVTDSSLIFDSPAIYYVDHEEIAKVLSFTHTYSGQVVSGETIEACGYVEDHGDEKWLVIGSTREARGEYIISKTLIEESG